MVLKWTNCSNFAITCFSVLLLLRPVITEGEHILEECEKDADPDACRNTTEIIADKGYPVEEHAVVTKDGYILYIQRIPYGRKGRGQRRRPVAFLQHGLADASVDWVINFPQQSLGYILADAGYDVWLGNVRGNDYSDHIEYTKADKKFWDFCFDDMIDIDLPTMIDYVLKKTGSKKLFYVGHSQGTMIMFGLLSSKPEYNKKIRLFAALAPVAFVTHLTSPIRLVAPFGALLRRLFSMLGLYNLFGACRFTTWLRKFVCKSKIATKMFLDQLYITAGLDPHRYNMSRTGVILNHLPSGTSLKNVVHFGQLVRCKHFRKFDYGFFKNRRVYGQRSPPDYDLTQVTAPTALFWSMNDWLADPKDVRLLAHRLPNVVFEYQVEDPDFSHIDFTMSLMGKRYVYPALLSLMDAYRNDEGETKQDEEGETKQDIARLL